MAVEVAAAAAAAVAAIIIVTTMIRKRLPVNDYLQLVVMITCSIMMISVIAK
jgi:hypothetical protein